MFQPPCSKVTKKSFHVLPVIWIRLTTTSGVSLVSIWLPGYIIIPLLLNQYQLWNCCTHYLILILIKVWFKHYNIMTKRSWILEGIRVVIVSIHSHVNIIKSWMVQWYWKWYNDSDKCVHDNNYLSVYVLCNCATVRVHVCTWVLSYPKVKFAKNQCSRHRVRCGHNYYASCKKELSNSLL
jgi:hypothetical protein